MILRCVAAALLALPVTVLDPEGRPAPDVAVTCSRGPYALVLTGPDGRAELPDGCLEATCQRGGLLPGTVRPASGQPCRVARALQVRATVRGDVPQQAAIGLRAVGTSRWTASAGLRPPGPVRFDPVPAGRYTLVVVRFPDHWSCATELGSLPEGEHAVVVDWREPLEAGGTVLDPEGRPFPKVLLHVVYEDGPAPVGSARCEEDRQALDPLTDPLGCYAVRVDPARPFHLDVDAAWMPATVVGDP